MAPITFIRWITALFATLAHDKLAASGLGDNGKVITLGDIAYCAGGVPISILHGVNRKIVTNVLDVGAGLIPSTIMHNNSSTFSATELNSTISNFLISDDVFQSKFLQSIYLASDGVKSARVDAQSCASILDDFGTEPFMVGPDFNVLRCHKDQPQRRLAKWSILFDYKRRRHSQSLQTVSLI